ncbi:MAG: hypothetical protein JW795_03295, partial [Chitinivibrionales bacterium]|nr:hypothetical protein [Chitinivibrionales bacterium]
IVLIPVVNSSEYIGTWNISEVFTAHLRQEIQKQNRISCTTATIDEKSVDPIALGARYRATYVITGEVRKFDIVQKAEVSASADKYREYSLATVCLDVQLINTENKTVIFQNTFCGEITAPNAVENTWNSIRKLPFTLNDSTFANSILGKAVRDALNESASQLSGYISEN